MPSRRVRCTSAEPLGAPGSAAHGHDRSGAAPQRHAHPHNGHVAASTYLDTRAAAAATSPSRLSADAVAVTPFTTFPSTTWLASRCVAVAVLTDANSVKAPR